MPNAWVVRGSEFYRGALWARGYRALFLGRQDLNHALKEGYAKHRREGRHPREEVAVRAGAEIKLWGTCSGTARVAHLELRVCVRAHD